MGKKTVSLSIEEEVYEKYRKHCEEKGKILSKQVELFMLRELERDEERSD